MRQGLAALWTVLFLVSVATGQAMAAEKRIALVMGNSAYQNVGRLANPANDARLIAKVLRAQGFEVIERLDLTQKKMKRAIRDFTNRLRKAGRDTIGFVFYAGHGLQIRGLNYLVPVDAEIATEGDVDIEAISANSLLFGMKEAGNRLNVIVFDACRNNPYRSLFRSGTRGLAQMGSPRGSLVAFSTAPGDVAADGIGGNSPYSVTLAKFLAQPGLRIQDVFMETRQEVYGMTKQQQLPWESTSLIGSFYPAGKGQGSDKLSRLQKELAQLRKQLKQKGTKVAVGTFENIQPSVRKRLPFEPEVVLIPGGTFNMGCVSGKKCRDNEKPVHRVTVSTFYMSKYETTFAQWDACVKDGGCTYKPKDEGWGRGKRPVINVSWNDAKQYVQWLSSKTSKVWRLPTEAEWEYAARASSQTKYSWGNSTDCSKASYYGDKKLSCYYRLYGKPQGTKMVGGYSANSFGLHDMHGNVWEWVSDSFEKYTKEDQINPKVNKFDSGRVMRGGSWRDRAWRLRSASRDYFSPGYRQYDIGFRLVRQPS